MNKGDTMNLLVSVVVPIFNTEKYLERAVGSLLNQTYRNIEIILVDDGSNDNSGKICDELQLKDKRIKVIHKKNAGVSEARNSGIKVASGEYITFVDSDDYVNNNYIYNMYKKINNNIIICENATNIMKNKMLPNHNIKNDKVLSKDEFIKEMLVENIFNGVCWGKLYITKIVKEVLFNSKYRIAEDLDFNIRYLENSEGNCKIINNTDYFYFINNESTIHSSFNNKWYDEIEVCKNLIDKYKNKNNEIYCIKRFIRINLTCLTSYKIHKYHIKNLKNNIRQYKTIYLHSKYVASKDKLKLLFGFYFPKTIYFIKQWRKK